MYSRIRDLREDADLTQKQLADELLMHLTQYRRYETGERDVPFSVAIELAKKYNVSLDYIAGISNIKTHPNTDYSADEIRFIEQYRELSDIQKGRILERMDIMNANNRKNSTEKK